LTTSLAQQQAMLRNNQQLLAISDSSLDLVQVLEAVRNEDHEIVDFVWTLNNHAAEQVYGDVIGLHLLTRNPGVVDSGIFDTYKQVVETGQPNQQERHYMHEQFNSWYTQSTVKLGDGVATTTADITARKEQEQLLLHLQAEGARQSEDRYHTLFTAMDEGYCLLQVLFDEAGQPCDWRFEEVNPAFAQHKYGRRRQRLHPRSAGWSNYLMTQGLARRHSSWARLSSGK
jgi:PAS domain-containing protein